MQNSITLIFNVYYTHFLTETYSELRGQNEKKKSASVYINNK